MKEKPINKISINNQKNQKQQKNDIKSKNQNNVINRVNTSFSNDKNNQSNNIIDNKNILKDSLNLFQNDNLNNNKNNERINQNIERYSNLNKVNRRIYHSRDKILKDSSLLNKVKSKNEFYSNNMNHLKWITKFPNCLFGKTINIFEEYITNYNKDGLKNLKKKQRKKI